jgi:hypothetical protein
MIRLPSWGERRVWRRTVDISCDMPKKRLADPAGPSFGRMWADLGQM